MYEYTDEPSMPIWLQLVLKSLITITIFVLIAMIIEIVCRFGSTLKNKMSMVTLYTVMVLALLANLFSCWLDPFLFAPVPAIFVLADEVDVATIYLQFVFIQMVFLMTLESMIFVKNNFKFNDELQLKEENRKHAKRSKIALIIVIILDILLCFYVYFLLATKVLENDKYDRPVLPLLVEVILQGTLIS